MKRLFSGIFSVVFCWFCCCSCVTALAESYENTLKKAGFSEGYIAALTALHQKYPAWEFVALDTGLNWSTAFAGERAAHKNQIIAKSSTYGDAYYCACSQCKVNGKYVVRYGSSCVAASEWAVAYFMDPRNWLDETHIFEFESKVGKENTLLLVGKYIFNYFKFGDVVNQTKYDNWVNRITKGYNRNNFYHHDSDIYSRG